MTSDFRPEVEIWPFRACAMKNMQYNLAVGHITRSTERTSIVVKQTYKKSTANRTHEI